VWHKAQDFSDNIASRLDFLLSEKGPEGLRRLIGKPYLVKTLDSPHRPSAVVLARKHVSRTDALFQYLWAMTNTDNEGYRFYYTVKVDLDIFGKVKISL
jgi:hypothetical protein